MIKFFKKIRHNFLIDNKNGKYLKYAIGEIILVVIGILIALQINNWNTERKNLQTAHYLLNSLQDDLMNDVEEYQSNIMSAKNTIDESKRIQLFFSDSVNSPNALNISEVSLGVSSDLKNITYNEMLNSGSINLLPKEIRKDIAQHYWYIESYDGNRDDLLQLKRTVNQLLIENGCSPNMLNERDFIIALKDKRLQAAIRQWEFLGNKQIGVHEMFMQKTKELIKRIEEEKRTET